MIVYLHGFGSGIASAKAAFLKRELRPVEVVIPDYPPHHPLKAVLALRRFLVRAAEQRGGEGLTLVGSSLGGYYAQYLGATLDSVDRVVLINPALEPQHTLRPFVGTNVNLVTGTPFEFTLRDLHRLARFALPVDAATAPTLLLLDDGDELIDYRVAWKRYAKRGRVVVYHGGSHSFEHLREGLREIGSFHRSPAGRGCEEYVRAFWRAQTLARTGGPG